ncbi:hypothetical protein NHQ30_006454 [Ciborinia camelliae]|nr:hypothetical protein NHQ30_006454 [Ciborinia camelliae]
MPVEFSSTTKSCGSTGYSYTSPTPVALNRTATSSAAATATPCMDTYIILADDSCNKIAKAQNVINIQYTVPKQIGSILRRLSRSRLFGLSTRPMRRLQSRRK